jgi:sugar phosphate isomerase/epimerase
MFPKISAFPKCFFEDIVIKKTMSLFDWIEMSIELEAEGLEMYSLFFESYEADYLNQVKCAVEKVGLCIPMFCCSPDLSHPDSAVRRKEIEMQELNMETAAFLGCETCRVLSGQRHPSVQVEEGIKWVVSAINELLPLARKLGIKLAMENHYKDGTWQYPEFAQKQEIFLRIVESIEDPDFGVQYDPSNAIVAGYDPIEFLQQVKERVVSMHASDRYLLPGHALEELAETDGELGYSPILKHGEVGKGLNDYKRIFSILAEINYQGWISIEDGENGMDEMKRSIEFLKKMRQKYFVR